MSHQFFSRNPTVHHYEEQPLPSFYSRGYYSSPKEEKYRYQPQLEMQDIPQPTVQFKVFAFNQLQSETGGRFNLHNASAIYRFELNANNKSFGALLCVLNSYGISSQTHKLYYQDEEQDFVNLSNEADFRYMAKIMNKKGTTIKMICEKDFQREKTERRIPVSSIQQPRTRALPYSFFRLPLVVSANEESKNTRDENSIENGFDSALPRVCKEGQLLRDRGNRLSELLKKVEEEKKQKDQKKEEQPQRKPRSFEDLVAELFEKKLAERKLQEEPTPVVSSAEEESNSATEPTELVVEQQLSSAEEKPSLSTSQIISSYLVADEDDDDEEQYIKLTENEPEESTQVQYPVIENEPEPSLPEPTQPQQPQVEYENELKLLSDMGFSDSEQNITLLKKYNGNIQRVVSEIIYF